MARILAIDTSSAWCSVALSLDGRNPLLRYEAVTTGSSRLLLPWIHKMLAESAVTLNQLDAIAIGIGPGAFTGVRLGIAVAQGLAISQNIPVISVASLDAIATEVSQTIAFKNLSPKHLVIAIDARMDEIYWAKYECNLNARPVRQGVIHLSKPEDLDLRDVDYLAGSAVKEYKERLGQSTNSAITSMHLNAEVGISALGILACATELAQSGLVINVRELEPLYVRDKVALTTAERLEAFK